MSIPIIIFAGIYFILFLVWVVLTLVNVYHVLRYAYWTRTPLIISFVYLFFAISVVAVTGWLVRDIDWSEEFTISQPSIESPIELPGTNKLLP